MIPEKGLYVQMFSIHGLVRAEKMELGSFFGVPLVYTGHSLGRSKKARLLEDGYDLIEMNRNSDGGYPSLSIYPEAKGMVPDDN